ncbi:amino acid adenylation domain-containing protein [Streptomyces sp. NPDC093097]|uniref:non-ribosomal peptide synthetase n=1 Tax=Streptomyces sp. NPDC093097 TaxID=3366027 RepID=UPI00381A507E
MTTVQHHPPVPPLSTASSLRYAPFPMTETQQALMIGRGDAVEFGSIGCYGYFEWERPGLAPERLAAAWRAVVDRHDMLRTVALPDGTQQVLENPPEYDIPVLDLSALDAPTAQEELARLRREMSHRIFPVGSWPLFDLRIIWLAGGICRVHLGIDLQVLDASSAFEVLFPDLIDLYENPSAQLPALGMTFADYVRWRTEVLPHTDGYRAAREYWLNRAPALPPAPDLPAGAPGGGPVRFDRHEHRVPQEQWRRLQQAARRAGLSESIILTAAFAEVLRCWSGTADFTINYPVFPRPQVHEHIGNVLGDFTNAVLLEAASTGETFADRAAAMGAQLERDLAHSDFNGIEVLRELTRLHGAGARAAMPVVVTSLLDHPGRRPVSDLGEEIYSISQTPQVSLDVQLRELDGELRVIWDFVDGAFAAGFIADAFEAYVRLIGTLADTPESWGRRRFDLIPPAQRAQRREVNDTSGQIRYALLHELFDEQAARTPHAEAVVDHRRRLSYQELSAYAHRIGRTLREAGAKPGELIAVVMDKGWEQYAAVYGVLASGAAYLPLDASVPTERLHRLLAEGQVRTILTQASLDERLTWPAAVRRYSVDTDFETGDASPLPAAQIPADLAYTIFTSGSTGEPKGVMVDHLGVINLISDVAERFSVNAEDRLLAISGLHFDASIYDVFGVLTRGGTVVLPPPFEHAKPEVWAQLVAAESVTIWNSVPVLMELLVGQAETIQRATGERQLESLRLAVLSGDWIPLTLPDRLRSTSPRIQVVGSGGPTETICWSVFYPIHEVDPAWTSIPYGKPITNQRYFIVDEAGYERPVGVVGEMAVTSDVGLALGYWNDPERTADRFIYLPESGERSYLTGDLGRYLPDGNLEILGRDDFQVKIQGHRVELGEIETALRQDPAVRAAVVVAPTSAHGVRRLHGHLILSDPAASSAQVAEEVRERLAARLPEYLVPAVLTVLEELPLTRNGKVDRLALSHAAGRHVDADALRTPQDPAGAADGSGADPLALVVCLATADILGLDQVLPGNNFFRLGGDSLSGTRLAGLLRELLGVPVPVKVVFQNPEAGELAARIGADPQYGAQARDAAKELARMGGAGDGTPDAAPEASDAANQTITFDQSGKGR